MIPLTVPPVRQTGRGSGGGMFPHTPHLPCASPPPLQSSSSPITSGPPTYLLTKRTLGVAGALLFYICASISLTMFNKWLFADAPTSSPFATRGSSSSEEGGGGEFSSTSTSTYNHQIGGGGGHDGQDGGDADDDAPPPLSPYERSRVTRPPPVMPHQRKGGGGYPRRHGGVTLPPHLQHLQEQPQQGGFLQHMNKPQTEATTTTTTTTNAGGGGAALFNSPSPMQTTFFAPLGTVVSSLPSKVKSVWTSQYGFQFPLTVTCIHQFLVFLLAVVINRTRVLKGYLGEVEKSPMALRALVPLGIISGIDWGLSNTSLRYVPLSLYEIVKASSPVIVLVLSLLTGTTRPSWRITGIVLLISFGMLLSVSGGDAHIVSRNGFPALGFTCLLIATVLSALRVVYTQIMLHTGGGGGLLCCPQKLLPAAPSLLHLSSSSHDNGNSNNSNNKGNAATSTRSTNNNPNTRYVVSRVPPEGGGDTSNEDRVQMRGVGGAGQAVYNTISMLVEHRRYMSSDTRWGASVNQLDKMEEGCNGGGGCNPVDAFESNPLVIRTASSSLMHQDENVGNNAANMVDNSNGGGGHQSNNTMGAKTLSSNSLHHNQQQQQQQQHPLPAFTNPNRPFNMLTVLYYSAPASCVVLILPALFFEGGRLYTTWGSYNSHTRTEISTLILGTSIIAFLLAISEFLVTILTSALTLCITGIAKQVLIIGLAMVVFGDHITMWSSLGFALSVVGIGMYNYDKLHGLTTSSSSTNNASTSPSNNNNPVVSMSSCTSPNINNVAGSDSGHKSPPPLSGVPSPMNINPS